MSKRAVTYARVSYDDRDTDGRNLASQLDMCRVYCAQRGHTVVRELREDDRGASGADFDLPGLTDMLEMAEAGEFDVLVVREVDRLSRDQIKAAIIRRDLKKLGIEIEYVLYDFPPGPTGDLARQMMEAIAEYQRQDAIIKTARGRRNSIKAGNINVAGRPPYGYAVAEKDADHPNRRLVINEHEARNVRLIFDLYAHGDNGTKLTLGDVTRRLNELGILTPSESNRLKGKGGKRKAASEWNRDVVVTLLKKETYIGRWYYGKRSGKKGEKKSNPREHWIEREVPAIVDAATWTQVQQRLDDNRRSGAWHHDRKQEYLMRHLLTCGRCESGVQCDSSKPTNGTFKYRYYKCCAKRAKLTYARKCDMPTFRADWVDNEIWTWIHGLLTKPRKLRAALREVETQAMRTTAPLRRRLDTLKELLAEKEEELERLMAAYVAKVYTLDQVAKLKAQLEEQIAAHKKTQRKLEAQIKAELKSIEQIQAVEKLVKDLGPNVERATRSFEIRRGLMEDLQVEGVLAVENGEQVVYASSPLGKTTLRQASVTTSGTSCPTASTACPFTTSS